MPPLLGVLAGSVTLTGGPATGLAFAPLFEAAGVTGAASLAVASAMVGIVCGGIVGGPIGTRLIERRGLRPVDAAAAPAHPAETVAGDLVLSHEPADPVPPPLAGEDPGAQALLKGLVSLLAAMAVGAWISKGLTRARPHAAGLHRRDAGGGAHCGTSTTRPAGCGFPTACSTTSATRRSRSSSRWRS